MAAIARKSRAVAIRHLSPVDLPLLLLLLPLRSRRRLMRTMEEYEVVKDLGAGNFGVARLMRNKETDELVAMKYIPRSPKVGFLFSFGLPLFIDSGFASRRSMRTSRGTDFKIPNEIWNPRRGFVCLRSLVRHCRCCRRPRITPRS